MTTAGVTPWRSPYPAADADGVKVYRTVTYGQEP